jgi:DNA polymerase IV
VKLNGPQSQRSIVHLDLDAFYASVEQHDFPELRGRPVIVGGSLDRGVVSACSYEARAFGIHSAMAMARAVRLCPHAVVVPVRMKRYRDASQEVFAIVSRFSDRIERLSIDEAFIDLTGSERLFGAPVKVAQRIREEVRECTGLAVSAGVAPNKFLAKLASGEAKPDGVLEVGAEDVQSFLFPLPLSRIWGIGQVTSGKLERLGMRTVADLHSMEKGQLVRLFGSAGEHLYRMARGIDDRPVTGESDVKSVGNEETFWRDLSRREDLHRELLALAERVGRRLREGGVRGRTLTLKVRYADFSTVTRSETLLEGIDHGPQIFKGVLRLLGRTEAESRPVRLLGVSLSHLEPKKSRQSDLFEDEQREKRESLDRAVDRLAKRFGSSGPLRATLLEGGGSGGEEGDEGLA